MEKDVAIVVVGQSPFTRRCGVSIGELCFFAYLEALGSIRLKNEDIDASVVCSATEYDKQRNPAGVVCDYLNLRGRPTFCVESLCSSSSSGLRVGYSTY
jgi:acetyl-CoA C-acetyltransferase